MGGFVDGFFVGMLVMYTAWTAKSRDAPGWRFVVLIVLIYPLFIEYLLKRASR